MHINNKPQKNDNIIFHISGTKDKIPIKIRIKIDNAKIIVVKNNKFHLKSEFPKYLFSKNGIFMDASFFVIEFRNIKLKRECIHKKRMASNNPVTNSRIITGNINNGGMILVVGSSVTKAPAGSSC